MSGKKEALRALLPEYINGHLGEETVKAIRLLAEEDPEIANEIAFYRKLSENLKQSTGPAPPSELGWARLARTIDKEEPNDNSVVGGTKHQAHPRRVWLYACGVLVVLLVGQLIFFPFGDDRAEKPGTKAAYIAMQEPVYSLQIVFSEKAHAGDLQALLHYVDAQIYAGPSAGGSYRIGFDSVEERDSALQMLRVESDLVLSVEES